MQYLLAPSFFFPKTTFSPICLNRYSDLNSECTHTYFDQIQIYSVLKLIFHVDVPWSLPHVIYLSLSEWAADCQ